MTEQQIEHLKSLLDASDVSENSEELDGKILRTARARVMSRNDVEKAARRSVFGFIPHGFMRSAVLSVALTLVLFLGLGAILNLDQPERLLATKPIQGYIDRTGVSEGLASKQLNPDVSKPQYELMYPPITERARDQILAQMQLPDTQTMLNNMEFQLDRDRAFAQQSIAQAMSEIRFMINDGEMNDARQRYEMLRRSCTVCTLPKTLEALALNDDGRSSSG